MDNFCSIYFTLDIWTEVILELFNLPETNL